MFYLHLSNRTENLLARLVETLAVQPRRDLFAREYFLIQSQGMERMLSQRLADAFGVWCNFEYLLPTRFFEVMAARLGLEINPEAFGRDNLTWRLDALLQVIAEEEQPQPASPFAPLLHYMGGEQGDLKRFQLARQLANLFDQYQIMRPEMLAGWQRQKTQTGEPAELWQMVLWARLRAELPGVPHRGEMLHQFLERIQGDDDLAAILPTRLFLFGLHSMPPLLLACLHGISRHCDVHLCLLAPCQNYWADLPGKRQLIRENLRRLANSQEAQPLLPDVHPLLHSLARQGQDFQTMLLEQVDNLIDTDDFEDPAASSPGPPSLLHRLQSDLLDGGWGGHTGNAPQLPDDSLTIVSCHSAIREVMVLKDQILRWLEKNPDMELRDILVMAPDIQDYAAIIPAIFHDIQHSIADRSQRGQNPYLAAFLQFLDLTGSRHTWSDVLDLLEKPEISRTFALDGPDLELIRHWVADAGIRWGLGPEQLHALGLPSQTETTWHAGLERLLLGYAMDWNLPVNGVLPYPDIEGSQARPLGELCRFIALLTEAARDCLTSHPLSRWSTILLNLSVTLFGPDSSDELARLRELFGGLHERFGDLHHHPVPLEVVRSWLEASAEESKSSAGFLRGQLTFCSMLPMRSIPFAAICLLGLNDGAFPKNDRHPPFDLLGAEFRPGDRSRRGDDRYQFLEALLSARRYLFLSYIGQSIRSGHVIPPSVLISELVESLRLAYGIENPTQLHPLQPFSARYFRGSGLFSYDAHQCAMAQALRQPPLTSPSEPWWSGRLAEEPGQEARRRANVHDLLSFFAHPQRWFVTRQLDIQLAPRDLSPEEHEPFDLDGLTRYQISEELIQTTLSGLEAPEVSLLRLQAEGRWPLAAPGRQRMEREQDALCDFARRIRARDMGNTLPPLIIDLEWMGADGRTMHALGGQLANLHENGILLARYATCKGKDLLRAWIHHLLAAAALPETAVTTHLLTSDLEFTFPPCAAPLPLLEQLMAIFAEGCSRPSPLLVEAAWRYVRQQGKAQARTSPLQAATTYLQEKLDNGQEPELTLLYGERQAATLLDSEFVELCETVVAPIFFGGGDAAMTTVPVSFDAATAPLQPGVNLVEASAGTGKTFAIAMLVLRFVTERNIPLPEILVVTFTKAATEELKDRIRARLASARELLAQRQETEDNREDDPALTAWREGLQQQGITEELALHRLELALLDMDLAPVFTIHGFCQRMLQEQAMESGQLFDFELTTDTARWRLQVVHDYWRRTLYPLPPLHCALITSRFATPDALFDSIKGAADRTGRREPACSSVADALQGFDHHRQQLAAWWRDTSHTLYTDLSQAIDQGLFKKELRENFDGWWQQVDAFLAQGHPLPDTLDFLSADRIRDNLNGSKFRDSKTQSGEEKKQAFLDSLTLPEPVISELLQAWQGVHLALRAGLLAELSDGLARSLRHQGLLSFDELIRQLAQSLAGAQGAQLRRILRARYPVALIDEFQDTDDDQFFIFSTLFAAPGSTENERPTGRPSFLYLIGDPKQAIYTFRGADIYSYFTARRQAARHLNLARNHRSHPALVAAVNGLFSLRPDAFFTDQLGYHPVQPARKAGDGQLLHGGAALPVMVYGELEPTADPDGRWHSGKATDALIGWVVAEIQRISNPDYPVLLGAQGTTRPLAPRDIAILVRSNRQAEQMQGALANAGIPVVMASRQPVFETAECGDLLLLLQAINLPGDARLLKTALTRPWFNLTGQQLYALWQDAEKLNLWLDRLYAYHQLWQERGFLTMMTALLEQEQLLLHLARLPLAERRITNIHHLLELIQTEAAHEAMGPARTVQWLQTMRDNSQGLENTELRLESDDEAVRIVTMHGAKGLEYPVVFCPFLWYRNNRLASEQGAVTCHDADNRLVTDLGSPDFAQRRSQAVEEELAEELRLAYVALTRARCRCYTCWAEVKGNRFVADSRHSALAWLLSLETGEQDFSDQVQLLRQRQQPDETAVLVIPAAADTRATGTSRRDEGLSALAPQRLAGRSLHTDWTLLSYSSLSASPAEQPRTFPSPASPTDGDTPTTERAGNIELLPELPKGAALGNVIHALLEDTPFTTLAAQSGYEALLRQQCSWFNVAADPAILSALLRKVVQTPLRAGATAFCLCDLPETDTIKEMPFYFRLKDGSTAAINAILADSPVTTPITPRAIKGYLTGFIDLICCHQGKFYIMDYKSNWLGRRLADYGPAQLTLAMAEHNYGLQYWLYTLVLHRYLRDSLDGYDYDRHFGGVCYLFVRGMEPSQPGSGIFYDLPDFSTLTRLDVCLGSVAGPAAPIQLRATGGEDAD